MRRFGVLLCALAASVGPVRTCLSQVIYPGTMDVRYDRILRLMNPGLVPSLTHSPSVRPSISDSVSWDIWQNHSPAPAADRTVQVLNPVVQMDLNTAYPRSYNDGPAWSGKGANLFLSGGISGRYKSFSYTFAPILAVSQNLSYGLADSLQPKSRFSYQFEHNIDWVQRYGDEVYTMLHPGQSEIRITAWNGTLGFSSQNFTWGPAQLNHILVSDGAPGFYHVDLGTYRPQPTPIGDIEVKTFWGWLDTSDYFRESEDHRRFVAGFTFGYAPIFAKGLSANFHRVMYKDATDLSVGDLFQVLYRFTAHDDTLNGFGINDLFDQMASISVDWKLPSAGFEAYFEFALNDFNGSIRRILTETEHARAYTLGFLKTFPARSGGLITLAVEHTSLSLPKTSFFRASPTFYEHDIIRGGYTHQGQIVGAGIGPGGTSDYVGLTYYNRRGSLLFDIQRIRFNEDYFANNVQDPDQHDAEFTFGVTGQRFYDRVAVSAALLYSYRFNVYYRESRDMSNAHLRLGARIRL